MAQKLEQAQTAQKLSQLSANPRAKGSLRRSPHERHNHITPATSLRVSSATSTLRTPHAKGQRMSSTPYLRTRQTQQQQKAMEYCILIFDFFFFSFGYKAKNGSIGFGYAYFTNTRIQKREKKSKDRKGDFKFPCFFFLFLPIYFFFFSFLTRFPFQCVNRLIFINLIF
ncbi:hypothetical protein V6Z11_A05G254400 [Gossypium hirsutum]